jgi:hypothetical protein
MIFQSRYSEPKLNTSRTRVFPGRLSRTVQTVCFSLLLTLVPFCTSKPPDLAKLSKPPVAPTSSQSSTDTPQDPLPVFAYYYIWFDSQSWNRAKTDYPILGRYSSDDADVMRQHVKWAKDAGIDGFIVSWKRTEKLNRRLEQLVQISGEEKFNLAIIYESLNFERNPLPLSEVNFDLHYFIDQYANHPVFGLFEKPMVIWSGTWEYSIQDIASVVQHKRDRVLILASEREVEGYDRLSGLVDGNAYYWSSVNPYTHTGYLQKMTQMSRVVHEDGGLWVAPAAPGFDARLVGGTRVVDRNDGDTLEKELDVALQSSPDAIGLISWNEFSENSHIEPSQDHGYRSLEVLMEILPATPYPR